MDKNSLVLMMAVVLCAAITVDASGQAWFYELGTLPGKEWSVGADISADGSTAVGRSLRNDTEAFRWTQSDGMVGLGVPIGAHHTRAYCVSGDGTVVVGIISYTGLYFEAYRWTEGEGMVPLGYLTGFTESSWGRAVSHDGSVIAGTSQRIVSYNSQDQAAIWTQAGGWESLGNLGGADSWALGISGDGSTVVGHSETLNSHTREAFRWTRAGGMVGLGAVNGESWANDASFDGQVIVGWADINSNDREACRWDQSLGTIETLGDLPGGTHVSEANAVSDDGSVVVGRGKTDLGDEAFLWRAGHGMVNLRDYAEAQYGLDLAGWRFTNATGISGDGTVIVGEGINPSGDAAAWVVVVPEPATMSLLALGGLAVLRRRKK